jgi:hypothetical protein
MLQLQQRCRDPTRVRPGQADDTDASAAGGRGNGHDGVVKVHEEIVAALGLPGLTRLHLQLEICHLQFFARRESMTVSASVAQQRLFANCVAISRRLPYNNFAFDL